MSPPRVSMVRFRHDGSADGQGDNRTTGAGSGIGPATALELAAEGAGDAMKVGIFQDLRNPPRWRREPAQHYRSAIERVMKAESLGLDSVWLSEHHLFEDGYLPQPFVYAAALAARTSTIRVGTAITVAPLYPAIDLAEKATMVDLISDGRFVLG